MNTKQLKEFVIKTLKENEKLIKEDYDNCMAGAGTIEQPDSLKKHFGLKKDEKITTILMNKEIEKLKTKDKDPNTPGIQGLTKDDLRLLKKLNLAKTLAKRRK